MSQATTQDASRQSEIQALTAFLQSEPEQWPRLVPQMLDAVGAPRLREIVETARRRVGRFEAVTNSPEGLVIVGHHARALAWVLVDGNGELTNLLIGDRSPRRFISRAARLRLARVVLLVALAVIDVQVWTTSAASFCVGAVLLLWTWLVLVEVDAPAAGLWWLRRALQLAALSALPALVRVPGLPFGDFLPIGPVLLFGWACWWIAEVLRARRHRWGLATTAALQLPVRGRWYVADGGVPTSRDRNRRDFDPKQAGTVDLLQVGWRGSRRGPSGRLTSYPAYGQDVFSPCAGVVVAAVDGLIDEVPPALRFAPADGNHVLIDTGAEIVRLAHLRAGSVLVDAGDRVHAGQRLGQVGNSGRSKQPHLSIDAVRAGRKLDLVFADLEGPLYSGRTVDAGP